jgi:phosphatidylcholine synthase
MNECKEVQGTQPIATRARPGNRLAAWLVHFYTATGALAAFFGTLAVMDHRYRDAFLWMALATLVDATDGVFARLAQVRRILPGFDGARLDDIVDYLTFVFLPVLLLQRSGALPGRWGLAVASIVLLSSAYGFASTDAKTEDDFFTGFPSYWNIVALYLHAAGLPATVNAGILLVLSALVFVRIGYVYPSRTPTLRRSTIALGILWGVSVFAMIFALPDVPPALLFGSLAFPIYYTVLSWVLHARRPRGVVRT